MPDNSFLWLGDQNAYLKAEEAKALALANYATADEDECESELLTVQDGVGIINIAGSLIPGHAGFMAYFGAVGYEDIREALVAAVQNTGVKAILLNIDSGGGAVAGCDDTSQLISRIGKIKPIVTYTPATMASAALWLGSAAKYIVAGQTALVGSLGIMYVHKEYSKQLAQDGVKVTIIRAGDQKALNNPYEPLSDRAKETLQSQASAMYDIFLGTVAKNRGDSSAVADSKYGQGRVFLGQQALDAGLIDKVGTLEDAFAKAKALGDKVGQKSAMGVQQSSFAGNMSVTSGSDTKSIGYNAENLQGNVMPNPVTDEQLIAMAAGVQLEAQQPAATPTPEATAPAAAETPVAQETTTETKPSELVAHLQAQVDRLSADLAKANLTIEASAKEIEGYKPTIDALASIARTSVKNMCVGLSIDAKSVDSLAAADLAAEHVRVADLFKAKFKVGGVAATNTVEKPAEVKASVDPMFAFAVGYKK